MPGHSFFFPLLIFQLYRHNTSRNHLTDLGCSVAVFLFTPRVLVWLSFYWHVFKLISSFLGCNWSTVDLTNVIFLLLFLFDYSLRFHILIYVIYLFLHVVHFFYESPKYIVTDILNSLSDNSSIFVFIWVWFWSLSCLFGLFFVIVCMLIFVF